MIYAYALVMFENQLRYLTINYESQFQIVFFLVCMCLFCTIASGVWETLTGQQFQVSICSI